MIQKTPIELEKAKMLKAARTVLRLKYSLIADEELNTVLPALADRFDEEIHQGQLPDQAWQKMVSEALSE